MRNEPRTTRKPRKPRKNCHLNLAQLNKTFVLFVSVVVKKENNS